MKISPRELREAQIPSKAFGFNQEAVDALLERAADTIEGLIEENRQLFEALERLRSETPQATPTHLDQALIVPAAEPEPIPAPVAAPVPEPTFEQTAAMFEKEELINKTLLLAQRTADETLREAKTQADELVENAETQANQLVDQAKAAAESLTGNAKEEADINIATAQEQAQQMVAQAQAKADTLVETAQSQADSIHEEERSKFVALVKELTHQRAQLVSDIEILQGFDQEHRSKLQEIVKQDLQKLTGREIIDVGAIPELPKVTDITPVTPTAAPVIKTNASKNQTSSSEAEENEDISPQTFDDVFSGDNDDVLISDDYEVDEIIEVAAAGDDEYKIQDTLEQDPFAAFVDSPSVVEPASSENDAQVVEPAGVPLESSDLSEAFDPSRTVKEPKEELNDDDFFASLREAVNDDTPLGPSDDEPQDDGPFKGLFKK